MAGGGIFGHLDTNELTKLQLALPLMRRPPSFKGLDSSLTREFKKMTGGKCGSLGWGKKSFESNETATCIKIRFPSLHMMKYF